MAVDMEIVAVEEEEAAKKAKSTITWSWVVTIGVSIFLIPIILQGEDIPVIGKMALSIGRLRSLVNVLWMEGNMAMVARVRR